MSTGITRTHIPTGISTLIILYSIILGCRCWNAYDIEYTRWNFADVELLLEPESAIDYNISSIELKRVCKYCQNGEVRQAQGKLCIPKYEEPTSFRNGCDANEYRVCDKYKGSIAMVGRGGCQMIEKAKAAEEHSITGLIIIETSKTSDPSDLKS